MTMSALHIAVRTDALALEYKRQYGCARRNIDIANVGDQPFLKGEGRVFGPGFSEKITDLPCVQLGTFPENVSHALLVAKNII
jgi:hypothetical protein